ncbi:hypothetical protein GCM10009558_100590 [Virgisporangium aurantiacum]
MAGLIRRFGTGYLPTTVLDAGGGQYVWIRRPGPDRTTIDRPGDALRATIAGLPGLAVPEPDAEWAGPDAVVYRVGGQSSVAAALLAEAATAQTIDVAAILRDTAATLSALHHRAAPATERLPAPPGPVRLLAWLRSGTGSRSAARLHGHANAVLGHRRITTAIDWCADLMAGDTLLHGAPGTGVLVPDGSGPALLLTGEDLSRGPVEADLGWLVGELVEHRETRHRPDFDDLVAAFLGGCRSDVDGARVGRAAALRYLTHTHDFAAYVGWHDELLTSLRTLAGVLDDAGRGALLPEVSRR